MLVRFRIRDTITLLATLLLVSNKLIGARTQLSVRTEHDMTKPTYGLQGQTGSTITYDPQHGLNLKGTINDFLGPPIKIANGLSNMMAGSNMAGVGTSLKSGGALLGFDAKLLEAAGGANLLKGGLLLGGAGATKGVAKALDGLPGKKIASIIEVPVKVVAMKDIATGKPMAGLGKAKEAEALAAKAKGTNMVKEGEALKAQGMNQVVQGATEGLQNIGNMMQQTASNAATAIKFLPLVLDLPANQQQQQQQQQQQEQVIQQHETKDPQRSSSVATAGGSPLTGGSFFGGLSSLLGGNDPFLLGGQARPSPFNLFGQNPAHSYAAVLNSSSPLTSLLMNPNMNPLLYPLAGGPLGQSIAGKQPFASANGFPNLAGLAGQPIGQHSSFNYNLLPGVKVKETTSSRLP